MRLLSRSLAPDYVSAHETYSPAGVQICAIAIRSTTVTDRAATTTEGKSPTRPERPSSLCFDTSQGNARRRDPTSYCDRIQLERDTYQLRVWSCSDGRESQPDVIDITPTRTSSKAKIISSISATIVTSLIRANRISAINDHES